MSYQQAGWAYPTMDPTYNLTQSQSPFTSNVSNYFRKPAKIVKPNSRNTSPRHVGRRRTTTSNVSVGRTRSMLDKQRVNVQQQYTHQPRSRPLSWHPNSYPNLNPSTQDTSFFISNDIYQQPNFYGTTATNGQYTPLTHPNMDEPQIHELITPLEGLSAQELGQVTQDSIYPAQYWLQQDTTKHEYAMDAMFPQQPLLQIPSWHWTNSIGQDLPTAPSSPSFLPIQGVIETSPLDLNTKVAPPSKPDSEELVAMGLYDSPAQVQSSSMLFGGGFSGRPRKRSLKLEEAFEPSEKENETEEANGNEVVADDEDDEAHISEPDESSSSSISFPIFQDQLPPQAQVHGVSNMAGHSFFFDDMRTQNPQQEYARPAMSYMMGGSAAGLPIQGAGFGWF